MATDTDPVGRRPGGAQARAWSAACARRLDRHGLSAPIDGRPADVVAAMCGAHAQVVSAAELSIGMRLPDATRADVRAALWTEHSLVKTYGPRGTVHLLPTRDLPLWTGALSANPQTASSLPPGIRMTPEQTDEVVAAIATALLDAELTVDELSASVVDTTGPWAGDLVMPAFQGMWPRWRQAIAVAANRGALIFGTNRGRKVTYTSPRRWLPDFVPIDGKQAGPELLRRYLHAYGPAGPSHVAQWLHAPRRWVANLFDTLGDELRPVDVGASAPTWMLASDTNEPPERPHGVRLLPYFDAYAVGCHPRELVFPGAAADRALARGQAGNFPVLVIDGIVGGVWHQRRAGRRLDITVEPMQPLTLAQRRELDGQMERIRQIAEGVPTLRIGTVTVGAHA